MVLSLRVGVDRTRDDGDPYSDDDVVLRDGVGGADPSPVLLVPSYGSPVASTSDNES